MITLRPAEERGHANHGWLDSRHTFSFAGYYDPHHMGFSALRVINDDRVEAGFGFDTHPHRDMEIISYVLEGSIEHRDTMGFHQQLKAGEVQVMSAGSGIFHSEYNARDDSVLHFLQIWIQPDQAGVTPRYAQRDFSTARGLTLIVSPDGRDDSLPIHQDASLFLLRLDRDSLQPAITAGRRYYLHVASGEVTLNGQRMQAGDGAAIEREPALDIAAQGVAEALLFDLP